MNKNKSPHWLFIALAFGFNWLILLPGVLDGFGIIELPIPNYALVTIAQFGPSLSAFYLVYRENGKKGLRTFIKRGLNFRFPLGWWVAILILPLLLGASAQAVHYLSGGQMGSFPFLAQPLAILPYFLFIFFLMGPLPEEYGWRGYLLERLQDKWNAFAASIIVGVLWSFWHLPAWYMEGVFQSQLPFWAYTIQTTALSVLMTWIYNNTGKNILAALVMHTMVNLSMAIFPPIKPETNAGSAVFLYLTGFYVIAAAIVTSFYGYRHLQLKQTPSQEQHIVDVTA